MSREIRAVVVGLVVVVLFAIGLAFWRKPGIDNFRRIRAFRVEVKKKDGGETRTMSFNVPVALLAQMTRLAHIEDFESEMRRGFEKGEITPRQILDAADESEEGENGKPGVIKKDDATIEVRKDGNALRIDVKDDWDKHVRIRVPRSLIEAFSDNHPLSVRDIIHRLDELDPGDVVSIQDGDEGEVTITAVPRRHLRISHWRLHPHRQKQLVASF
jgi:hypothetical protein